MVIQYLQSPVPHFIINDFVSLAEQAEIIDDCEKLYAFSYPGKMICPGGSLILDPRKHRRELNLNKFYDYNLDRSLLVRVLKEKLRDRDLQAALDICGQELFSYINDMVLSAASVCYYDNGDFYGEHSDLSLLTANLFVSDPDHFSGGDLILTNCIDRLNYLQLELPSEAVIQYKARRLVLFPSRYQHKVSVVKSRLEGQKLRPREMRITLQGWYFGRV